MDSVGTDRGLGLRTLSVLENQAYSRRRLLQANQLPVEMDNFVRNDS